MVNKDAAAKAFDEKAPPRPQPPMSPVPPDEGARLIRAFLAVKDPRVRRAIIEFVEKLA